MAAWNFETTGSPGAISQAFNNYLNGWIGIQPDQGNLQNVGTFIGQAMTQRPTVTAWALQVKGETDSNNTWVHVNLCAQPKVSAGL